eukprot:359163-Chlamydomonas_euryale.AAC.1
MSVMEEWLNNGSGYVESKEKRAAVSGRTPQRGSFADAAGGMADVSKTMPPPATLCPAVSSLAVKTGPRAFSASALPPPKSTKASCWHAGGGSHMCICHHHAAVIVPHARRAAASPRTRPPAPRRPCGGMQANKQRAEGLHSWLQVAGCWVEDGHGGGRVLGCGAEDGHGGGR